MDPACYLSRISTDVLVQCLSYLNNQIECKSFINFWIGCSAYSETKLLIHGAMLNIDVPYQLQKTTGSQLSQYLTSFWPCMEKSYFKFLIKVQQSCPRMKKLSIVGPCEILYRRPSLINSFPKLEKLIIWSATITTSFLKDLSHLRTLLLLGQPIINDVKNCCIKNITKLRIAYPENIECFPNLIELTVTLTNKTPNLTSILDLTSMIFLEKIQIMLVDARNASHTYEQELDVKISSQNLHKIKITPNVKIIADNFSSVTNVSISDAHTMARYIREFRSHEIFTSKHNIKHVSINSELESILPLLKYTPQLMSLSLDGRDNGAINYRKSKCYIGEFIDKATFFTMIKAMPNLRTMTILNVDIHASHCVTFNYLCAQSHHIKWEHVRHVDSDWTQYVPDAFALVKAQSFDVTINSTRWTKIVPDFAKIQDLTLRFAMHYVSTYDADPLFIAETFFEHRLRLAKEILNNRNSSVLCRKLAIDVSNIQETLFMELEKNFKNAYEKHLSDLKELLVQNPTTELCDSESISEHRRPVSENASEHRRPVSENASEHRRTVSESVNEHRLKFDLIWIFSNEPEKFM
jgi:hypothetical protein